MAAKWFNSLDTNSTIMGWNFKKYIMRWNFKTNKRKSRRNKLKRWLGLLGCQVKKCFREITTFTCKLSYLFFSRLRHYTENDRDRFKSKEVAIPELLETIVKLKLENDQSTTSAPSGSLMRIDSASRIPETPSVQVNLCQKHLFSHQLTHNMTTDCSLIYQFNTWTTSSEHGKNMLCTQIVFCFYFDIQNNLCTQHVLSMFWACSFHVRNW
jgi:hypothetical protein